MKNNSWSPYLKECLRVQQWFLLLNESFGFHREGTMGYTSCFLFTIDKWTVVWGYFTKLDLWCSHYTWWIMTQVNSCGYCFHSGKQLVCFGRRPHEILESFHSNIAARVSDYHRVLHQKFWSKQGRQKLEFQQKQSGSFSEVTQMTGIADGDDGTGNFRKLFTSE